MIWAVLGVMVGLAVGIYWPVSVPMEYAKYMSVAVLACLDTVFGGLRAGLLHNFNNLVFISGFFTNALMAAVLVYIGERIGIDLYYVALLAFGLRIFNNLAVIRHHFLKK
ncbi:MAG: small basic family protein [Negativicutes bacterium]|nr:small basic family protein [Negativicutes bacterium]